MLLNSKSANKYKLCWPSLIRMYFFLISSVRLQGIYPYNQNVLGGGGEEKPEPPKFK